MARQLAKSLRKSWLGSRLTSGQSPGCPFYAGYDCSLGTLQLTVSLALRYAALLGYSLQRRLLVYVLIGHDLLHPLTDRRTGKSARPHTVRPYASIFRFGFRNQQRDLALHR